MTITTSTRTDPVVRTVDAVHRLGTIVGVWAHPDDEVYLSGGLMAAAAARGQRVVVVTATRGEHGTDDPGTWPPARLAARRSQEIVDSMAALHDAVEHRFLGDARGRCHLDGSLRGDPGADTVDELAGVLADVAPDTVLTFGPDGLTGHGDHRAVSAWTDRAVRQLAGASPRVLHACVTARWVERFGEFVEPMDDGDDAFAPVPSEHLAVELELGGDVLARKVAALRAQSTQTASLEAALGSARYEDSVAGEYFRPAGRS
ncbi:LmbE family N-acetylglucosaminyl deacetylase [Actinomycetospora succinea]|uniref:LmbE family N-acetylglucosaminyl deacetylase n=1 Tax=Actinomycetospora succinea TaxID=663603 RepID=A0A4R6UYN4_9PSEU|nr:PIG-L family deacetylase [Actinomycetospora succinea]TDQ52642.1 LmbE family N-acetylglucosaminyl deacetylase [Actinomycetospora succinea]